MQEIIHEILEPVSKWKNLADKIGIPRAEQQIMEAAFR